MRSASTTTRRPTPWASACWPTASAAAAWPVETPLSLSDRMAAQIALARLGFNPGPADGVVGAGTRKALREWQQSRQLPADGYMSSDMVGRLKAQAGLQ